MDSSQILCPYSLNAQESLIKSNKSFLDSESHSILSPSSLLVNAIFPQPANELLFGLEVKNKV
jgi:hypothetical protein